jgi:ribosomal protein L15E
MNATTTLTVTKIDRRKNYQIVRAYRPGQKLAAYKLSVWDKGQGAVVAFDLDAMRNWREENNASYVPHECHFSTRYDNLDAFLADAR